MLTARDIAYEEWAENFEAVDPKEAFLAGVYWATHTAAKQCTDICEEAAGPYIKQGAFRCYMRIKDVLEADGK